MNKIKFLNAFVMHVRSSIRVTYQAKVSRSRIGNSKLQRAQYKFLRDKTKFSKYFQHMFMSIRILQPNEDINHQLFATTGMLKTIYLCNKNIFIQTSKPTTFSTNNIFGGCSMWCIRSIILIKEKARASAECFWRPKNNVFRNLHNQAYNTKKNNEIARAC